MNGRDWAFVLCVLAFSMVFFVGGFVFGRAFEEGRVAAKVAELEQSAAEWNSRYGDARSIGYEHGYKHGREDWRVFGAPCKRDHCDEARPLAPGRYRFSGDITVEDKR